jgi:hypothetical protein
VSPAVGEGKSANFDALAALASWVPRTAKAEDVHAIPALNQRLYLSSDPSALRIRGLANDTDASGLARDLRYRSATASHAAGSPARSR